MLALSFSALAAIAACAVFVAAEPYTDILGRASEPCAQVALQSASSQGLLSHIDATIALACLKSVPLDTQRNPALLKALRATFQFQSTLAYLKNPPPGALYPAVDIIGGLDDITSKLTNGYYKNEFDFQFDIYELTNSAHDFHFNYNIDIMEIFHWHRSTALVSLSNDGLSLPKVYDLVDVSAFNGSRGYTPAAVVTINGVAVETWLNDYAGLDPYGQDPDANYNYVLYNVPLAGIYQPGYRGSFTSTYRPQANETVLKFSNGTAKHISTYATTEKSFDGVVDGASFFNAFCNASTSAGFGVKHAALPSTTSSPFTKASSTTSSPFTKATSTASTNRYKGLPTTLVSFTPVPTQPTIVTTNKFFPEPLVITYDHAVAGYLPDDRTDLAVLQMPSFEPEEPLDFQNAVRELLATAQSQNRTKLLVDLRGNGGGYVYLAYDTFRQIFPSLMPFGSFQTRSPPLYRDLVAILDNYQSKTVERQKISPFDDTTFLDVNNQPFSSAQAFYGPYEVYGDTFTALERANLNKTSSTAPIDVYGFGSNTAPIPQVFSPENIVMLTDGFCGSTCALFTEFMKVQGHVKSIAVGGRKQDGAMQGVGGSKGAQVISLADIDAAYYVADSETNLTSIKTLKTDVTNLLTGMDTLLSRTLDGEGMRVNFKNNIRQNDSSLTPLQFVYEATDCRFFYTPAMFSKQNLVWNMAHDISWANASCVPGSAGQPSSLYGNLISNLSAYPPVGANYTFGAADKIYPSGVVNLASTAGATITPTIAASTGAAVLKSSVSLMTTTTPRSTSSTSSSASAATTSAQATGAAHMHSAGTGLSAVIALFAICLL